MLASAAAALRAGRGLQALPVAPVVVGRLWQWHQSSSSSSGSGASVLAAAAAAAVAAVPFIVSAEESKPGPAQSIDPKEWRSFPLKEVQPISHNTKLYRFELPRGTTLGMPVASCIVTKAPIGAPKQAGGPPSDVIRPYTPVSRPDDVGHFDLVIKEYPEGVMSKHIASLNPGDRLEVKGPILKIPYKANMKKDIGMIAGGTGITPMLQVIEEILRNPEDNTKVSLVFANVTEPDILLQDRLDYLAKTHPNFKVYYVLNEARPDWTGGKGFVTADIVKAHTPPPSPDTLVMVCGPPPMMKAVSGDKAPDRSQGEVEGVLKDMGYTKDMVFKF
eukprot:jgi/Chlat1/7858/Chrsp66S07301